MEDNNSILNDLLLDEIDEIDLIDFELPSPAEVSLEVDLMSVTENSGKEIKYTFTRKSTSDLIIDQLDITNSTNLDTSSNLTVTFSISGSAQLNTDYTLAGAVMDGTEYTVTIPAGATTAEVTITPIADSEIESDEAVKLTLKEGNDYIIVDDSWQFEVARAVISEGSSMDDNAVMAVISNDDPMSDAAWAKQFDADYGYEFIAVDDVGNTYVTGNFDKTTTIGDKTITHSSSNQDPLDIFFDETNPDVFVTRSNQVALDVFVAKFDKDGKVLWAEEFGDASDESVKDIAIDKDGNTYFAGLDQGNEGGDIFVTKFDKDGTSLWSKNFGDNTRNPVSGIEVDKDGNTFITGEFDGQLQLGNTTLDGGEGGDVFITKLDTDGDVLWAKEYGDAVEYDEAEDVVVDKEGNAYLFFTDDGEGIDATATVVKLDKGNGNELWNETFDSDRSTSAESIAMDDEDNIYVAGDFYEETTFGDITLEGGEGDNYIAKLDSDGDVLWAKDFNSQDDDDIDSGYIDAIAVDDMGNTYVTGQYYRQSIKIDDFMLYQEGGEGDGFIAKFDSNGEAKWAQNLGGLNDEYPSDIAVNNGKIYLAGKFYQEATFGDKTLKASDFSDTFLVKLEEAEEEKPEISLAVDSTSITEGSSNQITYTFTRKGDTKSELTVKFSVTGSATFTDDYTLTGADKFEGTSGEVTFKAEESTATVTLNIVDDTDAEEDETVGLELAMGSGYMLSATEVKTNITITKDEKDVVIVSGNDDDDDDDDEDDDTEFTLTSKAKQTFKFKSKFKSGKSSIKFSFKSKSINEFKEIAFVTVDDDEGTIDGISPDDEGYIEAALNRSQSIFSLLGNIPNGFGDIDIEKVLEFSSETRFRFLSVKGGTLQGVKQGEINKSQVTVSSTDFLQVTESEKNSFDLDFEGVEIKMKFDAEAKKAIGSGLQETMEVIDLRGSELTGKQRVKCTVNREAAYNNFVGFYQVTNVEGGIDTDGDGTADVFVGDAGYTQAAVQNRIASIDLSVENQSTAEFTGEFTAGVIVVPFLMVNGNPESFEEVFFPFLGANSDGVDHVMMLGENTFGFEDLTGGGDRDFNDFLVKIDFTSVDSTSLST